MTLQLVNKNLDATPRVLGIDIGLSGAISVLNTAAPLLAVEDAHAYRWLGEAANDQRAAAHQDYPRASADHTCFYRIRFCAAG